MSSLIDDPWGCDKSMMSLMDPSFLGSAPIGEQWVLGKGGKGTGLQCDLSVPLCQLLLEAGVGFRLQIFGESWGERFSKANVKAVSESVDNVLY